MSLSANLYSFTSRTALLAALAFACATPAMAADAAADAAAASAADAAASEGGGLNDIIVTAEKRPENLQKTAISISVLGTEDLVNRHVQSLLDLGDGSIPSLRVAPFFSRQSALVMNVRGIGVLSDSNQPARDQGVGVYVDGVYLGRAQGLGTAIYDVASIEVLKGPQGTLFGRNTEGGAVSIVTKRPSGEFHLNATGGIGNYGAYKGEVHLDLPSFNNFSVKLDGIVSRRDGLVKNPLAGASDFNSYDKHGFHAEVLWQPSPTFSADYSFDTSYDATTSLYQQLISPGTLLLAAATAVQPNRVDVAVAGVPEQPSVGRTHGHRLNLEWEATPNLTLKSITSYRALTQSQYDNGAFAPSMANATGVFTGFGFARYSLAQFTQDQFSQEIQAIGEFGRVKFSAGALYYHENVEDNAQAFNTNQFTNASGSTYTIVPLDYAAQRIDRASHVKTTSLGVYGQATYTPAALDEAFHLTLGARFTRDKKVGQLFTVNGATPNVNGVIAPRDLDAAWSRLDPLVNLAFDVSHDVHLYGKWSTGYKSGGANSRSLTYAPFNPETVSMFEVGLKTEFWNNKARLNLAAYTGTYKAIQLDFSAQYQQIINGVLLNTTRTTTETANTTSSGSLKGFEAELTLAPVNGLTLTASYAYNQVKIPNTINPFPQANGSFLTVPIPIYPVYTPAHSASGAIDYEIPLGGSKLRFHLDGNYDSGYYANYVDPGFNTVTGAVTLPQVKGDPALVFNGRIALAEIDMGNGGAKLTVAAWARNLFNEQHLFYKSNSALGGVAGFFNDPRTFGGEVNIRF
ncbi:MAG: TonB-dependent receptor [Novosphingobium sp.]|nr:TonB-dependent receptor [Novosphingobium sp.]